MPRDFEGSIAKIAQLLSPQSGNLKDVNVDDLQKVVSNMYVTMYNNESNKEGSLYKQASKKRAMNAMSATARGINMAEESKLGVYDLDASKRQRLDLSDVTVSKDYLKSMLNISSDLYTPLFACSRMIGWLAHNIENKQYCDKIVRPAGKYVGDIIKEEE